MFNCVSNLEEDADDQIEQMLATESDSDEAEESDADEADQFEAEESFQQKSVQCFQCGEIVAREKSVNVQLRDSSSKLSLLKKIVEIQEPLGVEYRCVQCRNCSQCKDADKTEKISIRE
jgi:hypothetical protein